MNYKNPDYCDLGGIGEPMNPFVDQALRFGPTRLLADPNAGISEVPVTGLNGRHFEPNQGGQLYGWRDALDVFTAASFLFPE
jgi:hypothetical protein